MRRLTYALRFQGRAREVSGDGGVLAGFATAPGNIVVVRIGESGPRGLLRPLAGRQVLVESEFVFTGVTTFHETGTVTFDDRSRLHFDTVGNGYIDPPRIDGDRHGGAVWRVTGGEGRFTGVAGLIATTLRLGATGELVSLHVGELVVPSTPARARSRPRVSCPGRRPPGGIDERAEI
jgi:hypothetical protein